MNIQDLQPSPELALKKGEKFYKALIEDKETKEQSYVNRPIFIQNKKDDGLTVHPSFLAKFLEMSETIIFLRHSALGTVMRYLYKNGVYVQIADNDLRKILKTYIENYSVGLVSVWAIKQAVEIIDCGGKYLEHGAMNADERYINFQNGLLELETMRLLPHTHEFMSTIQIPCDWIEKKIATPVFDNFINTFTDGNETKIRLLIEYIGAVLSNVSGNRFKKAMFLVGEGDCGKSVISKLLTLLIGSTNASERSLKRLSDRFGETAVYMKRLVFSSDLSFMKIDQMDRFKELTGGDTISIEFKNCEPFDYVFKGLMLFGMNSLPRFGGDKGVHVYNRMLIIKCSNVISKNQQDPHLIEKLYAEREGIIQKCVVALKDVIENNYQFHIPPECEVNLDEYKTENSSVVEFWNECIEPCDVNESHINKSSQVYRCYKIWALENGMRYTADSKEFANEISQYLNLKWKWEIISKLRDGNYLSNFKLNEQGRELAASNY